MSERGLVPKSLGGNESLVVVGAKFLVEVKQRPDGVVLVVVAVRPGQVSLQVGDEDFGVFGWAKRLRRSSSLAGVDEFAFEQEVPEGLPELGSLAEPISQAAVSRDRQSNSRSVPRSVSLIRRASLASAEVKVLLWPGSCPAGNWRAAASGSALTGRSA